MVLCKSMCVCMSFCEKDLPLVFETLEKATESKDVSLISNIRFPNVVNTYAPIIYECSRNKST